MHDFRAGCVGGVSGIVFDLPRERWIRAFPEAGLDSPSLFFHPNYTCCAGRGRATDGLAYGILRISKQVHSACPDCKMDISNLDVRFHNRSRCVPVAVRDVK